jgi:hypothetical protein
MQNLRPYAPIGLSIGYFVTIRRGGDDALGAAGEITNVAKFCEIPCIFPVIRQFGMRRSVRNKLPPPP